MILLKRSNYFFVVTFFLSSSVFGQVGPLLWSDEFNSGSLDLTKWTIETGTGVNGDFGTGQIDRATERPQNISFQNGISGADGGCLVITTRSEFYIDRNYTSGRINTAGKVSWGPGHRIVARVLPRDIKHQGQGFAFWMLPDEIPAGQTYIMWPQGGEIDIMEYVGAIPYNNLGTVHFAKGWENNQYFDWNHSLLGAYYNYENQEVPNPAEPGYGNFPPQLGDTNAGSTLFHTYGIDWYQDRIEFFIDDHVYHIHYLSDGAAFQSDGQDEMNVNLINGDRVAKSEYSNHFSEWHPFEHKMYAILSAGVGGGQQTYGGAIVPEAIFPCSTFIDWMRVYELNEANVAEKNNSTKIKAYPNPANKTIYLDFELDYSISASFLDLAGKEVLSLKLNQSQAIDVSSLSKGVYTLLINHGKYTSSQKVVVD